MTLRVSSSVEGIEPSIRDKAEAAARRAGMSLAEWMNSMASHMSPDVREAKEVAEIHSRLDSIARQVESISAPSATGRTDPAVARQLNDAISRLDARLSQISAPPAQPFRSAPNSGFRAPSFNGHTTSSPAMPMDFSIEEIVARQSELDGISPRPMPPRPNDQASAGFGPSPFLNSSPASAPAYPDMSGLERQLFGISSQIETLRRPDGMEQSIAAFRGELSDIRHAITEAMPRRAIESLENEIRSLGRRIDETRHNGTDAAALSGVERALSEIRGELRALTPAEQLAGFDDAIRNLGAKIDTIVRTSHDPGTIHQLEDAITALKAIVSNVASIDALNQLGGHVQSLSAKVDQLAHSGGNSEILSALEQRIAVLTSTLETRERPAPGDSSHFDSAVRAISDRLDHLQVGGDSSSAFTHVEQRIHHMLERLEASGSRDTNLGRLEEGLTDILNRLEGQRMGAPGAADGLIGAAPVDGGGLADTIKRELTDMRFSQQETERHTQDSLEVVHSTLGHVVDRLAQIEGDLRSSRTAHPATGMQVREREAPSLRETSSSPSMPPSARPELPNPAAMQAPVMQHAAPAPLATVQEALLPSVLRDIEIPRSGIDETHTASRPQPSAHALQPRSPIDPSLPPDHPLEPGTRHGTATPSERIAASQVVLNGLPSGMHEPASSSNFIQAARRAAQAAAAATTAASAPASGKPNRVTARNDAARPATQNGAGGKANAGSKIRAVLVGASVIVIVLGTVKLAMNLLHGENTTPGTESSSAPVESVPKMNAPAFEAPSITSPTPIGRQSMNPPPPSALPTWADNAIVPDVTGSIETPQPSVPAPRAMVIPRKPAAPLVAVNDKLPEAIGGPVLRAAALKGDPAAALEIGVRFAEGKNIPVNYPEAAKWYDRAVQVDFVPAMFRLGTLYEKGLGVEKNTETARRLYMQAAERGNAKAMHNLAVLDADGGTRGPDYKSASQMFRKAADRGVADSQYNLAVLYARGIGVEQNLAESFKWFSLAAAQGDADAGRKRDDIARRLNAQSLAAAKLAIQTFAPERQPEDAIDAAAPAGGWDNAPATKSAVVKPAKKKPAAR